MKPNTVAQIKYERERTLHTLIKRNVLVNFGLADNTLIWQTNKQQNNHCCIVPVGGVTAGIVVAEKLMLRYESSRHEFANNDFYLPMPIDKNPDLSRNKMYVP